MSKTPQPVTRKFKATNSTNLPLPLRPILDWSSFSVVDTPSVSSIESLRYTAYTSSGRAAIYQALLQLKLPPISTVLIPSYHCPSMISPVILSNHKVAYFGILANGLPNLSSIDAFTASQSKAMIVTHYFGITNSLSEVRAWCDQRGIALIEDCAHCYFGDAGERPVGAWGDFSTASISKFLPIPEGGLLASAHHPISNLQLSSPSFKSQLKDCVDIFELSTKYKRLSGLNRALGFLFHLKKKYRQPEMIHPPLKYTVTEELIQYCDMDRIMQASFWASTLLRGILPRGRIIARRRRNHMIYANYFENSLGARPLLPLTLKESSQLVPYVFPLWVDDADRVYNAVKAQGLPVFRWDKIWPGTPHINGDVGLLWSKHVLQLLCHQDLEKTDVERISQVILRLLQDQNDVSL